MTTLFLDDQQSVKEIIINKLIGFRVFSREDQSLYQLTLAQLKDEISRYYEADHPHDSNHIRVK